MSRRHLPILLCALASWLPAPAFGDAIVVSRAMFATTIAEYFVEPDRVGVELEIGIGDVEAFRNLLPDELYEKLGNEPEARAIRVERFFREDLVIEGPDGAPLVGRLLEIGPRPRMKRDEITGLPLPAIEGDDEVAIFARLEYALPAGSERLSLLAPRGRRTVSIGFVVYHAGIAVNDFRYLSPRQTLLLDHGDPWYSRFERRSLRRQYFAPMSGFLYVEPFEVRKEIVVRPRDLQSFVDLGLEGRDTIPVALQPELKRRVAEFLRGHHPVVIDGRTIEPELARIHFLERTLRTSTVVDPPRELDVSGAILGVIFVYPTDGLPEHVSMDWDLWTDRIREIPAASVDSAGALPTLLDPDFRLLEWQNFLKNPELPTLRVLEPPPGAFARALLVGRWILLALALGLLLWWVRAQRRGVAVALAVGAIATGASFWSAQSAALSTERAGAVVSGLLHNVYRAFDYRGESRIYDVLEQSVHGDLLARIYLETRRGLELASQGGARTRVKELELEEIEVEPSADGFRARATWRVAGSVGHWGHVHQRTNRYRADLEVRPHDGAWKLVDLEILDEQRI